MAFTKQVRDQLRRALDKASKEKPDSDFGTQHLRPSNAATSTPGKFVNGKFVATGPARPFDPQSAKDASGEYGVRWSESSGQSMTAVTKEKFFRTEAERDKFVEQVESKDQFIEFLGWSDPK